MTRKSSIGVALLICAVLLWTGLTHNCYTCENKEHEHDKQPTRTLPSVTRLNYCQNCFSHNYTRLLDPKKACSGDGDILMLILITTTPREIYQRHVLRQTWLPANNKGPVRHIFLLGATESHEDQLIAHNENEVYGDILQNDYVDSYFNLSIKVIMGMQWVRDTCPHVRYIVRTACDNYVHLPQLSTLLSVPNEQLSNAWFGFCLPKAVVFRKNSKWQVSRKEYPGDSYPPYCIGSTFVWSQTAMRKLLLVTPNTPYFAIEDIYFGMAALKTDIKLVNINGFHNERCVGDFVPEACMPDALTFSVHMIEPKGQYTIQRFLSKRDIVVGHNLTILAKLSRVDSKPL